MKNRQQVKLTGQLVFRMAMAVMFITFSFVAVMCCLFLLFIKLKWLEIDGNNGPLCAILLMSITSIIMGSFIGIIISYKAMQPIRALSDAAQQIAKGNYNLEVTLIETDDEENELNNLIRNFNYMAKKLSETETLRSDFVANVSHEFKTPISTIQGYVTLLQDCSISADERKEYINIIFNATEKLSNLTTNILKISKIDNQEVTIDNKEYNLAEQIRDVIIIFESKWSEKNINLDLSLPDCNIINDENLLQQVWSNILSNAIKFSPNDSTIEVYLSSDDKFITVTFVDHGIGMSQETIEHMFEKFYQGDKSHSKDGNGLGMALVKKILKLCNGSIDVQSTIGSGTKIQVSLPIISEIKN